ncbi:toll-like receptor 13 isoform X2 [Drosophila grimshawi]|uniref:GH16825 n=1 Tax=Drosophila grimshawi TaxID=7222 RepID=B4IWX0_DROGR|nr:toll-like receptor 13 isoform X2 [Drosophila grimshawi]EDV97371.1 GH16825 [Drosophila grimshawi]
MYHTLKIILIVLILQLHIRQSRLKVLKGDNIEKSSIYESANDTPQLRTFHLADTLSPAFANPSLDTDAENNQYDINDTDLKSIFVKYDTDDGNTCILDNLKQQILSWSYPNGTLRTPISKYMNKKYLDISYANISEDMELLNVITAARKFSFQKVEVFSAAYNNLNSAPFQTLLSMRGSLKYLSLQGNQFAALNHDVDEESIAWATFPSLPHLLELDISNCSIEYVRKEAFQNVNNLRKLFLSNNKIFTINVDTFFHIQQVQYLDMSFMNVLSYSYPFSMPTIEVVINLLYGLKIHQTAFKMLPELIYLDLSHSKMTRNSAVAFTHLGDKLKYLSLCYTSFPMMTNGLFKNTILEGLDLSGNPIVSNNIVDDAFEGIGETLVCLYFERSNIKDIGWLKPLKNLQILGLAGNNINALSGDVFQSMVSLQVLDLSYNHIGNWYRSVFFNNLSLRVLSVRSNNVNMLTIEMLKDFELLEYLSLGDNNFLCNCNLRKVIDVAAQNNKEADCSYDILKNVISELNTNNINGVNQLGTIITRLMEYVVWKRRYVPLLDESYKNIKDYKRLNNIIKMQFQMAKRCPDSTPNTVNDTDLKFQLLDYDVNHYWCFDETEKLLVEDLVCQTNILSDLETQISHYITVVMAVVGSLLFLLIFGFIIYLKRWHIHYYYASLKSAALLSRASKESLDKFHRLSEEDPGVIYDIFISYCQNDRQWLLDELLPNVEESGDISICLHERDFQIGVTILDNIISCMDRSRSLMLLISSKFLLSHWCQFEMYLAQHRIFETSKEHLILVFLEDIPRSKRPKTLQYLMDIKTYIKWPSKGDKQPTLEERKFFWKRLRKSLELIGIATKVSKAPA